MSGPTLIANILPRASKAILGKDKSRARLSMARLIDQWAEIIAPEDPLLVRPVRVGWKKIPGEEGQKASEGTLYITAPSALAPKITFQETIIVARVNRLFGLAPHASVRRINLSHDRLAAPLKKAYRAKIPMGDDTRALLETVDDPVLRERLSGLADAMASEKGPQR